MASPSHWPTGATAASLLRNEELASDRYLLAGDSHQLKAIRETQEEMRQLAGRVRPVNSLADQQV